MTAHNQWLSKTGSISYLTMSVFSTVTVLFLIYESFTSSASAVRWLIIHSWTLNYWTAFWILLRLTHSESESYVTNDGQSASLFWNKAPTRGLRPDYYHCQMVAGLLMWGALSCCWPSPAKSFSCQSPVGLATIFYCLRFETSLFVASYDTQGYSGGIRPRLHTSPPFITSGRTE
jgi:hypothetical protein